MTTAMRDMATRNRLADSHTTLRTFSSRGRTLSPPIASSSPREYTLTDAMCVFEIGEPRLDTGMRPTSQSIASTIDSAPSARSFASLNIHTPLLPEEICWILDRVWGLEMEYHTGNLLAHTVFTFLWVHEGGGRVPFPEAQSNQGSSPSNHGPSPYGLDRRLSTDTASFSSPSTPFSTPTSLRTRFAPAQVFRPITVALLKSVDLAAVVMEGNLVDVSRSFSLIGSCFFFFLRHSLFDFFVAASFVRLYRHSLFVFSSLLLLCPLLCPSTHLIRRPKTFTPTRTRFRSSGRCR
ncbi:hypothetical protein C8J56DRAFT_342546 [Mycena floridula]|nr:hypothetical protein C8J56DRAFT_342546 [Mycena floridula]